MALAPRLALMTPAITAVPGELSPLFGTRRRPVQLRLGDVGDGWRALLLGAPPAPF